MRRRSTRRGDFLGIVIIMAMSNTITQRAASDDPPEKPAKGEGLVAEIHAAKKKYLPLEPIRIRLVQKNTGEEDVYFWPMRMSYARFEVVARRAEGRV